MLFIFLGSPEPFIHNDFKRIIFTQNSLSKKIIWKIESLTFTFAAVLKQFSYPERLRDLTLRRLGNPSNIEEGATFNHTQNVDR